MEIKTVEVNLPSQSSDASRIVNSQKGEPVQLDTGVEEKDGPEPAASAQILKGGSHKAFFAIDESSRNVVVRVVDEQGNIVRQYPPEEYLKMSEMIKEGMKPLFEAEA